MLDRFHAFSNGRVFARPDRLSSLYARIRAVANEDYRQRHVAALAWQQFDSHATVAAGVQLGARAWCVNGARDPSRIELGENTVCRGVLRVEYHGRGRIFVGSNVYIGDDVLVSSAADISIGSWTLLAHGVSVFDNDSHPVNPGDRREDWKAIRGLPARPTTVATARINIGDDVWVGFGASIMKGVAVGNRAVIAAGSVVTRDVAPDTVVAGNPARVVGSSDRT